MDWSQVLYLGLLLLAVLHGRPALLLVAVMAANLGATMAFAGDPMAVAVADMTAAAVLAGTGRRENIVALIFIAMQPVYVVAFLMDFSPATTYTCIDALAYLQLGVIGGVDRYLRPRRGRGDRADDHQAKGGAGAVARASAEEVR